MYKHLKAINGERFCTGKEPPMNGTIATDSQPRNGSTLKY